MDATRCELRGKPGPGTVVYLPGLHGDWTLATPFAGATRGAFPLALVAYARNTSDDLPAIARSVLDALAKSGVAEGWLLAESFGSQVAWEIVALGARGATPFRVRGLVLAGGFVRYPWPWLVGSARAAGAGMPSPGVALLLRGFLAFARWKYGGTPEGRASVDAFAARRREPGDVAALTHRLRLIRDHDPGPVARAFRGPVWSLAGRWDVVVPMPLVHRWLRRDCPGWRGAVTLPACDHVVLACRPADCAAAVARFVRGDSRPAP